MTLTLLRPNDRDTSSMGAPASGSSTAKVSRNMGEAQRLRVPSGFFSVTFLKSSITLLFFIDRFELNVRAPVGEVTAHFGGQECTEKAGRAFPCTPVTRPTPNNSETHRLPLGAYYTVD